MNCLPVHDARPNPVVEVTLRENARQSASHVIMRRGSKGCVVPLRSEVNVGTLAGVLRQAEVSADEFIATL